MFEPLVFLVILRWNLLKDVRARDAERGSVSLEQVIIAGGLALLAIAVIGIISTKVTTKASSIPTEGTPPGG